MSLVMTKTKRSMMKDYGNPDTLNEWECLREQMINADNYWLCSSRPDGSTQAEPVWGAMLDENFYFASGQRSVKIRDIGPNTEIAVHMESGDDTVIMEGRAALMNDLAIAERLAPIYATKSFYKLTATELLKNGLYRLEPSLILAWEGSDFRKTATRWVFDKKKKAS
jgi:hypothetical protein